MLLLLLSLSSSQLKLFLISSVSKRRSSTSQLLKLNRSAMTTVLGSSSFPIGIFQILRCLALLSHCFSMYYQGGLILFIHHQGNRTYHLTLVVSIYVMYYVLLYVFVFIFIYQRKTIRRRVACRICNPSFCCVLYYFIYLCCIIISALSLSIGTDDTVGGSIIGTQQQQYDVVVLL